MQDVQYSTVQYSTVKYSTTQCSTVQYSTTQYITAQYSTVEHDTVPDFFTVMSIGREPLEHFTARHMYVWGARAPSLGPKCSPLYTYPLEGRDFTPWPWPVWVPSGTALSSTSSDGKKRLPI